MKKFLTVVRREYLQGVRSKTFLVSTALGPVFMVMFILGPGLLIGMKAGRATRLAVVDLTEGARLYEPLRESLLRPAEAPGATPDDAPTSPQGSPRRPPSGPGVGAVPEVESLQVQFEVERAEGAGRSAEELKAELNGRVRRKELDAYVVLPSDVLRGGRAEYYARNTDDLLTVARLEDRLSRTVVEQRMRAEGIDHARVRELSRAARVERVKLSEEGEERQGGVGGVFFLAIGVAGLMLIAILMYGQAVLSAVVEEKTTRIAEVLFSSVRPFPLMAGKLVGVSLVGLTQYAVWALLFLALTLYGAAAAASVGMRLPSLAPSLLVYALLFFLMGFYLYATIYAVVGAIVTTEKEAGQIIIPVSLLFATSAYLSVPVIRSPDSSFSFWVSMIPFFSPVTMLVRVMTETPPGWQIALSLAVGAATTVLFVWLAARVYRTGMLMYGKRATVPEVLRWIRQ
ncbi:MAG TPA: ABC transporter permease [Pyrinomonadaceae bacterium]|nr:ABC transporter permease [Pyrinomonadaceae bacterium]